MHGIECDQCVRAYVCEARAVMVTDFSGFSTKETSTYVVIGCYDSDFLGS